MSKISGLKNVTYIDHQGEVNRVKSIDIENGIISYIGDSSKELDNVIDCSRYIVTPTFCNLHSHIPMWMLRGIAEDVNINEWFNNEIWPYESQIESDDVAISSYLGFLELINNGITVSAEHYMFEDAICNSAIDAGIHLDIAPTLFSGIGSIEDGIQRTLNLRSKMKQHPNINVRFGPHSPYTVSDEDFLRIVEVAKQECMGLHFHISESSEQVKESIEKYGLTPLDKFMTYSPDELDVILAHGLYLSDSEIEKLQANWALSLSPSTYMKLSMGLGNLIKLSETSNAVIGTDGPASSNTMGIIEQTRDLGKLCKFSANDSTLLNLNELWKIMMRGHSFLPFNTGRIEVGASADMILWDLNKLNTLPINNLLASIIYGANETNIDTVISSGNILKSKGKLTVDYTSKLNDLRERLQRLDEVGKGVSQLKF